METENKESSYTGIEQQIAEEHKQKQEEAKKEKQEELKQVEKDFEIGGSPNNFKIEINGHSGNTTINQDEKEYLQTEIAKILKERGIEYFDVKFFN